MTPRELIEVAASAYDGLTDYVDATGDLIPDPPAGDTLGLFIARELNSTFEATYTDEKQLLGAIDALREAVEQLEDVISTLESRWAARSDGKERDWVVCHTIARWETLKLKVRAASAEGARDKAREIVEQVPTAEYEPGDLCSDVDDEFDVREACPDGEGSFYEPESY